MDLRDTTKQTVTARNYSAVKNLTSAEQPSLANGAAQEQFFINLGTALGALVGEWLFQREAEMVKQGRRRD